MTAILIGCAASSLVIWAASRRRVGASRVRSLQREAPTRSTELGIFTWIGSGAWNVLQRLVPRGTQSVTVAGRRRLGMSLLVVTASTLVSVHLGIVVGVVLGVAPWWTQRAARIDRQRRIVRELPLAVDLVRIAIRSGLNIRLAVEAVAAHAEGPLALELHQALRETANGRRLSDTLDGVIDRTSEDVRPFVSALASSERYGAPLSVVLERLAHETRVDQERRAEQAARRLSVQLLFPLAGCTLPAFALLTVAPLLAGSISTLASSFN